LDRQGHTGREKLDRLYGAQAGQTWVEFECPTCQKPVALGCPSITIVSLASRDGFP